MFEPHPPLLEKGHFLMQTDRAISSSIKLSVILHHFSKHCVMFLACFIIWNNQRIFLFCVLNYGFMFSYILSVSYIKSFRIYKLWRVNGNWIFDYKAESSNDINKMSFLKIFLYAVHNSEILQHYLIIWRPS